MKKIEHVNPINAPQLCEQIQLQRLTGSTLNVFGPSGGGKTTIMTTEAAKHYDEVRLTNGSGKGPVEFTGLGLPRETADKVLTMNFSQPEGIPTVERVGDRHVYWCLDEFGNWEDEIRATFHGVLAPPNGKYRMLGTHKIGKNVHVGITSNRRCDGADVGRFHIPEMLRGTIVTFIPDPANWWQWADTNPDYASTHVPAFIAYGNSVGAKDEHKNHFLGDPVDFDPLVPNPLPNPRSWEEVMKVLILKDKGEVTDDQTKVFVEGRVGAKATQALNAFRAVVSTEPLFEDMKNDPKNFPIPSGVAQQFMLASGSMLFAVRGVTDIGAALHNGKFDWIIESMRRFSPEVGAYGLATAERRGVKVSERDPVLYTDLVGS